METAVQSTAASSPAPLNAARLAVPEKRPSAFVPLEGDTRTTLDTACAAYHLNRRPQTLRGWACKDDGPLRPVRVHGRLGWPTAELRKLLGVE